MYNIEAIYHIETISELEMYSVGTVLSSMHEALSSVPSTT